MPIFLNYADSYHIFDQLDIKEKTKFKAIIYNDDYENNNINCRLFKLYKFSISAYMVLFCDIEETNPKGYNFINFNSTKFNYNEYEIIIEQKIDFGFLVMDSNRAELYSIKKAIVFEDNKDSFDLKFKIYSYNNENMFLCLGYKLISKIDCNAKDNDLICLVKKNKIEEI